jgi:uncharacterized alpha-E superfamily protein
MTLPRTARATYWLARYLQRLDDTVRFVEVQINTSLEYRNTMQAGLVLAALGITPADLGEITRPEMLRILLADRDNTASVPFCSNMALADARAIRDMVPSELYETVNALYRAVSQLAGRIEHGTSLANVLGTGRSIHNYKWAIFGLVAESVTRDQYWHLFRIGALIEYLDMSIRLLRVWLSFATDDYDWITILRSLSAYEAFLRRHNCDLDPAHVLEELFCAQDNPRSLAFTLKELLGHLLALECEEMSKEEQAARDLLATIDRLKGKQIFGLHEHLLGSALDLANNLNAKLGAVYFDPGGVPTWHLSAAN